MKKLIRKVVSSFLACVMMTSMYIEASALSNVTYPSEVKPEMVYSDFWKELSENSDDVLLTTKQIKKLNTMLEKNSDLTNIVNLENIESIGYGSFEKFGVDTYINGKVINQDEYIAEFKKGHRKYKSMVYAVAVKRAVLKIWPIDEYLGEFANDPDDENAIAILNPNDPFVIGGKTVYNGKTYYYGRSDNCSGWVEEDAIARCSSKEEWLEAWKVNVGYKNFIVVTEDTITLDASITSPETSKVELPLGTVLKLVPKSKLPESINERGIWFNYAIYIPTRNAKGKYERKMALIPVTKKVSVGYLPFTESNILDVSFEVLGKRFGWGGCLDAYDSSLYHRAVYTCFGIKMPRNGTWQRNIPGKFTDVTELSDEEKLETIKELPVGSILYIPGFSMQYIGMYNGVPYVICSNGFVSDSKGELKSQTRYSVIILPLTVRKASGNTWLTEFFGIVNIV